MKKERVQIDFDAVIFDCDGTLSRIEGIDELAELNSVGEEVKALTHSAMAETGLTPELYKKRLELCQPKLGQIYDIGHRYIDHKTAGLDPLLATLRKSGIHIYVISAGILHAVQILTDHLRIAREHVFAVDVFFDHHGEYQGFSERSPLTHNEGKRTIVQEIKKHHKRIALIGDGKNDLACQDLVDRFIGFGGNYRHAAVENAAELYVSDKSILEALTHLKK